MEFNTYLSFIPRENKRRICYSSLVEDGWPTTCLRSFPFLLIKDAFSAAVNLGSAALCVPRMCADDNQHKIHFLYGAVSSLQRTKKRPAKIS